MPLSKSNSLPNASPCSQPGRGWGEQHCYLVRKRLGLVTLTDEAFVRRGKLGSVIIDIQDPDGHRDFGFLMPVVWKGRLQSVLGAGGRGGGRWESTWAQGHS